MAHRLASLNFLRNPDKLARGIWPWNFGIRARLPKHYKQRYVEAHMKEFTNPTAVHWQRKDRTFTIDAEGNRKRVVNAPVPVTFPAEADQGLWGGEGIVRGYTKKDNKPIKPMHPKYWMPRLMRRVFYSEILDQWMTITVTRTTLDLIDQAAGFDNYILKTHEADLKSKLGMKLKREMLLALSRESLYPDDPEKRKKILKRYQDFIIPEEEAEWIGLSLEEAEEKQRVLETEERQSEIKPLKHVYASQLLQRLQSGDFVEEQEGKSSWLSKLNPFQDKPTEQRT